MSEYSINDTDPRNIATALISNAILAMENQTPSDEGINYKPLYYGLFNGITDIIREADTYEEAVNALKQLQCAAEEFFAALGE